MANFAMALPYVLQNEGGFCVDDGGPTNYGLTCQDVARYRQAYSGTITEQDMRDLQMPEVSAIYQAQYWSPLLGSQIVSLGIATAVLDTAVNRGVTTGVKYAQRTCNISGFGLSVDGVLGTLSLAALNQINPSIFIANLSALDEAGYLAIVAQDPGKYQRYEAGWLARAKRLLTLI